MNILDKYIEIKDNNHPGYKRLVEFGGWTAASITFSDSFNREKFSSVSRHNKTDEVFVLVDGNACLLVGESDSLIEVPMEKSKFYNVKKGVWHALFASADAKLIVAENSDTGTANSEVCENVTVSDKSWSEFSGLSDYVEINEFNGEGYRRMFEYDSWTVAVINYSENFNEDKFVRVEKHNATDEVFVLVEGQATLVVGETDNLIKVKMEKGKFYNVKKEAWHHVFIDKNAEIVIVENSDTGSDNSELYYI